MKIFINDMTNPAIGRTFEIDLPVVPRVGEYVASDEGRFSGRVHDVNYWQPEGGEEYIIEVRLQ